MTCQSESTDLLTDFSAAAGGYTTLVAVLAGFAFSGLILMLTVRMLPEARRRLPRTYFDSVRALLATFISLGLVAINYAFMGGLATYPGPVASHAILYGQAFAIGAMQLMYAIILIVATAEAFGGSHVDTDGVFDSFQGIVLFGVAPFVGFAIVDGTAEYRALHGGGEGLLVWISWLPMGLVGLVGTTWLYKRWWKEEVTEQQPLPVIAVGGTGVVATLTVITFLPSFNPGEPCGTAGQGIVVLATVLTAVTIGMLARAVSGYRSRVSKSLRDWLYAVKRQARVIRSNRQRR